MFIAKVFKTLLYIVAVWFIWRWLDRAFGGSARGQRPPHASNRNNASSGRQANDENEGEYVDFEELKD